MTATLKTLIEKYKPLKRNKVNTKSLILELMKISSADFSIDRLRQKLYKCKFGGYYSDIYKWLEELCQEGKCIFVGYRPEKVFDRVVGHEGIFGIIRN